MADNASEAGRATNRRIEFTLVSPDAAEAAEAGPAEAAAVEPAERAEADGFPAMPARREIGAILAERSIQFAAGVGRR